MTLSIAPSSTKNDDTTKQSRCVTVSALQSPIIDKQPQLPNYIKTDSAGAISSSPQNSSSGLACLKALKRDSGLDSTQALLNASIEQACLSSKLEQKSKQGEESTYSNTEAPEVDNCDEEADPLELTMTGFSIDAIRNELARIKNHK